MSLSVYTPRKRYEFMVACFQRYWVREAPSFVLAYFLNHYPCHGRDLSPASSRAHGLLSGDVSLFRKVRKKKARPPHMPIIEGDIYVPSKGWAEMIRKVYEVDPLFCPRCGGQTKIISLIEDHKVIDKIIRHLKITFQAERPPPPPVVQHELLIAAEQRVGYS